MRLEEKVAIMTGSGKGLGRVIALTLAEEGTRTVVSDVDDEAIERTAEEIRRLGREVLAAQVDVTSADQGGSNSERAVNTASRRCSR